MKGSSTPNSRIIIYRVLLIFCIGIALLSTYKIVFTLLEYRKSADIYKDIKDLYYNSQATEGSSSTSGNDSTITELTESTEAAGTVESTIITSSVTSESGTSGTASTDIPAASPTPGVIYKDPRIQRKTFDALHKINPDIAAWIKIPNTLIDYPVLQGKDNEYYLTHSVNHEIIKNASLFLDYRNNIKELDFNTIIYGHNMHDSTMFGYLPEYKNEVFLNKHPYVYLDTMYAKGIWEVFSVYVTDTGFDYLRTGFKNNEDCQKFIDTIKSKSLVKKDMEITPESRILTMSTCSYEFKNARLVVHAKLIEK